MKYLAAKCRRDDINAAYQVYMSDAIKNIAGGKTRFADIVYSQFVGGGEAKEEDGEAIKSRLKDKLNAISR